jgi:hypothetical protein
LLPLPGRDSIGGRQAQVFSETGIPAIQGDSFEPGFRGYSG